MASYGFSGPMAGGGGGGFGALGSLAGVVPGTSMGGAGGGFGNPFPAQAMSLDNGMMGSGDFQHGDWWGDLGHKWAQATHGPQAPSLQQFAPVQSPGAISNVSGSGAPQIQGAQINAPTDFRNQQNALAGHLLNQAMGQGPSIAATQTQNAMGQAMAQQFALANANQGSGHGAALRQAQGAQQQMGAQSAIQSGLARLAEQQQAAGTLGQVAQGARGQDLENSINQAQLSQGAQQFNAGQNTDWAKINLSQQLANQQAGITFQNQLMQQTGLQNQELLQKYGIQNQGFGAGMMAGGSGLAALAALMA